MSEFIPQHGTAYTFPCITKVVNAFFKDRTLLPEGLICPPVGNPFTGDTTLLDYIEEEKEMLESRQIFWHFFQCQRSASVIMDLYDTPRSLVYLVLSIGLQTL